MFFQNPQNPNSWFFANPTFEAFSCIEHGEIHAISLSGNYAPLFVQALFQNGKIIRGSDEILYTLDLTNTKHPIKPYSIDDNSLNKMRSAIRKAFGLEIAVSHNDVFVLQNFRWTPRVETKDGFIYTYQNGRCVVEKLESNKPRSMALKAPFQFVEEVVEINFNIGINQLFTLGACSAFPFLKVAKENCNSSCTPSYFFALCSYAMGNYLEAEITIKNEILERKSLMIELKLLAKTYLLLFHIYFDRGDFELSYYYVKKADDLYPFYDSTKAFITYLIASYFSRAKPCKRSSLLTLLGKMESYSREKLPNLMNARARNLSAIVGSERFEELIAYQNDYTFPFSLPANLHELAINMTELNGISYNVPAFIFTSVEFEYFELKRQTVGDVMFLNSMSYNTSGKYDLERKSLQISYQEYQKEGNQRMASLVSFELSRCSKKSLENNLLMDVFLHVQGAQEVRMIAEWTRRIGYHPLEI